MSESARSTYTSNTSGIRLVLADVDGTLVTPDKELTKQAISSVDALRAAGILFAITSGRPPRGMEMLVQPLHLETPIAGFNGGLLVNPDMTIIEERTIEEDLVSPIADLIRSSGLVVWLYRGPDWFVPDINGPHVARESWTVKFGPKLMTNVAALADHVVKIVGVSDDQEAVERATKAVHDRFGDHVTAETSQPYYLDVTHPDANKGAVSRHLAGRYQLSVDAIATIGDMANDCLMFDNSGLSIAMGNADDDVKRAAKRVTDSNDHDGFAKAMNRFVLNSQT